METDDGATDSLETRIARLEERITRLEGRLAPAPPPVQTVSPASAARPSKPVPPPSFWQEPASRGGSRRASPAPSESLAAVAGQTPDATLAPADNRPDAANQSPRPSPAPPIFGVSLSDLEERLAGRALAVVGGVALILGAIFFLSLAFSRGWIGPELRVVIGLASGSAAVGAGWLFLERGNRLLGHVLTPVGLAIISLSFFGATRLYHIIPTELGLVGVLLSSIVVAMVAVRYDSQIVAAFGLVSVLLAPPLLGADPDATVLAFMGAVLVGTTAIALWRSWPWLPPLAFLLTAPQVAAWILGDPEPALGLVGVSAFWLIQLVAAGGESIRRSRDDLSPSAATLVLSSAAFTIWAGFAILSGDLAQYRGMFLVALAGAHLLAGGYLVARDGERNLFALLTLGSGIAVLTMAMPIQLGASAVPIAWTAEAVALAWIAARRGHPYSLVVSVILYLLAAAAVVSLYPFFAADHGVAALIDARGGALAFFLGGVLLGIWILHDRSLRAGLAALGVGVAGYCAATVFDGLALVTIETGLMLVAAAAIRWLPRLPLQAIEWMTDGLVPRALQDGFWGELLDHLLPSMLIFTGLIAAVPIVTVEAPLLEMGQITPPSIPFSDVAAAEAAILAAGILAAGAIIGGRMARRVSLILGGAVVAYIIPYEVFAWAVAVLWVALALGAVVVARRDREWDTEFLVCATVLVAGATIDTFFIVAPPVRLVVGSGGIQLVTTLQSAAALGAVAIGVVATGGGWGASATRWTRSIAFVVVVYLLSVVVVDLVGSRAGGPTDLEEIQTQGQVALSVLWAVLGVITFVAGLRWDLKDARQAGLALLALATAKVFLFDLAALDVAYRVISLIALGLLLLVSAWLWQRAQPEHEAGPS